MVCKNMIEMGEQVWWKKGSGVRHLIQCEEAEALQPDNSALIIIDNDEWKDFQTYTDDVLRKIENCQRCGISLKGHTDKYFNVGRRTCEGCFSA